MREVVEKGNLQMLDLLGEPMGSRQSVGTFFQEGD